jgi:hypothetical protein
MGWVGLWVEVNEDRNKVVQMRLSHARVNMRRDLHFYIQLGMQKPAVNEFA